MIFGNDNQKDLRFDPKTENGRSFVKDGFVTFHKWTEASTI